VSVDEQALTGAVQRHLDPSMTAAGLRRLTGGASNETWSFELVGPDGSRQPLILRIDRRGDWLGPTTEARLLRAADAARVPVPQVRFVLDEQDGLGAGYVMSHVEGETIPRRILRDERFAEARPQMARQAGRIAARLHAIPLDELPELPGFADHDHPATAQIAQQRELLDTYGEPHPVFELALRWLEQRVPDVAGATLVHGDFRNGNFVVGEDGIRAVLDWELAHIGDPVEDLGWLCVPSWRFRQLDHPVGGFGHYEDLLAGYAEVSGREVNRESIRFWEVLGTVRWGVICIVQAFTHLHGLHRSVELAAIGRRVAEMEHHLLEMID
jgi:aminoglycoside phosphotransferase (APT) family kinase protein